MMTPGRASATVPPRWVWAGLIAAVLAGYPTLPGNDETAPGSAVPDGAGNLVRQAVHSILARGYIDERKWNRKAWKTVGVRVERDGLLLSVHRKKKLVNHGKWERYEVHLADPKRPLDLRMKLLPAQAAEKTDDGKRSWKPGQIEWNVRLPLRLHARWAKWERGVQLWCISANARADVDMRLVCRVTPRVDLATFPPRMTPEVRATTLRLRVRSFTLERISQLHGPLVRELGKAMPSVLNDFLAAREPKLLERVNRKLAKTFPSVTKGDREAQSRRANRKPAKVVHEGKRRMPASRPEPRS